MTSFTLMNWTYRIWITLIVVVTALAIGFGVAQAAGPCPENPKTGKCVKPSVSYSYVQSGRDQYGNRYTRTCYVPLHGKRHCSAWHMVVTLRRAFPIHHATKADLP